MSSQKDKGRQNSKALYSEDFQAMLEKLEEEDNADTNRQLMKKSRLCIQKVKALERHFELENRLQPERKLKIAEEVGLEPRQVAIWFQNRRARWRAKQLEKEYDDLRANYDALKQDYGSLEQEKMALLAQLKELKAKIKSRDESSDASIIPITTENSRNMIRNNDQSSKCMKEELPSSCTTTTTLMDPLFDLSAMDGLQLCKAYQDHYLMKMEELGVHNMINNNNNNNNISSNFFSVDDHAPTMHYYWFNNNNNNINNNNNNNNNNDDHQ